MIKIRKATEAIEAGRTVLGLELGSTRIKAVLLDLDGQTLASGSYGWENVLEHGIWTYALDDAWRGVQAAYESVAAHVEETYHVKLARLGAVGVSAMMHGYLAFDKEGNLLAPFRTWRNNITGEAAEKLSELFGFHIPQRWSVAHIEQALLRCEEHTKDIAFLTTLAGYVHWQLTGEKVLGVGDASGMFPIDEATGTYREDFLAQFDALPEAQAMPWKLRELLPEPLPAGKPAGHLTEAGARLLDPTGGLAGHGQHECRPEAHGQHLGGHVCFLYACARARPRDAAPRYRHRDDAGRRSRRDGACEQLLVGHQRLGAAL